jgi:hypothetical protein
MVNGKMLLRVIPVLILLVGLTQLSCRTPDDLVRGQDVGPAELRQIRIWVDHTVQPPEPRANPDEARISRARGDRVEWILDPPIDGASLEIRFKKDNPLTELSCPPQRGRCDGGHARPDTRGRFLYMIIVTSGNERYESDPALIVDP